MTESTRYFLKLITWLVVAIGLVAIPKYLALDPGWFVAAATLLALAYACAMVAINSGRLLWSLLFNNIRGIRHLRTPIGIALGALIFLYGLIANGFRLYDAIESGSVKCAYRYCYATYFVKDNPDEYWSSVSRLAFMEAGILILCILAMSALFLSLKAIRKPGRSQ